MAFETTGVATFADTLLKTYWLLLLYLHDSLHARTETLLKTFDLATVDILATLDTSFPADSPPLDEHLLPLE